MNEPSQQTTRGLAAVEGKLLQLGSPAQWRDWLAGNGRTEREAWLILHHKGASNSTLDYAAALDEALCYGWIDSEALRVDDARYAQRFSPRTPTSGWSDSNKRRALELIAQSRMAPAGLEAIERARAAGRW